jgi:hypothetical protein
LITDDVDDLLELSGVQPFLQEDIVVLLIAELLYRTGSFRLEACFLKPKKLDDELALLALHYGLSYLVIAQPEPLVFPIGRVIN